MKEKCSIRFLLMVSVAALALGGGMGYFAGTRESLGSYEKRIELLQEKNEMLLARQEFLRQEAEVKESLKVVEPEGFVLLEEDGFVAVYEADRKTRYSTTGILLDELPEELRQEIQQGKVIESEEQRYNFRESYSS